MNPESVLPPVMESMVGDNSSMAGTNITTDTNRRRSSVMTVPNAATSKDQVTYEAALQAYLDAHPEATEADIEKLREQVASGALDFLFFWSAPAGDTGSKDEDGISSDYWLSHRPYLIKRNGSKPDLIQDESNEVTRVRKELEARSLQEVDDEVRNPSAGILPRSTAVNGPAVTEPVGTGRMPPMEISVVHDQVQRISSLSTELDRLKASYDTLSRTKEAADRRNSELLVEIDGARKLTLTTVKDYDARIAQLQADLKESRDSSAKFRVVQHVWPRWS